MEYAHRDLAEGRWAKMSLMEQMANIGSEVGRAAAWKKKNNKEYCQKAFERALELIDLTLATTSGYQRLKEIARTREILCDYFAGENEYHTDIDKLNKYFYFFAVGLNR